MNDDRQLLGPLNGSILKKQPAGSSALACSLPPLPKKAILHTQPPDHYWYGHIYGYTEKQMLEYAKVAIAANNEENHPYA